jgi:SEC-C motif
MHTENAVGHAELQALLTKLGAKLSAQEVHALFLGALSGTTLGFGPERLLNVIAGDAKAMGDSFDETNAAVNVLFGYWNTLIKARGAGAVHFAPGAPNVAAVLEAEALVAFAEHRARELEWFVCGLEVGSDDMSDWAEEPREVLLHLAKVSGGFEAYAETLARPGTIDAQELSEARALLLEASSVSERLIAELMDHTDLIRKVALEAAAGSARTSADGRVRGGAASGAGRNDRCPCASGKKFKHCCGAPGRLH